MEEVSVAVPEVLRLLGRITSDTFAALVVGCGFHDGEADSVDLDEVIAADGSRGTLSLASGAMVTIRQARYRDGEFVDRRPGAPLAAAVRAARTPAQIEDEAERGRVRRAGFDPAMMPSSDARRAVLLMVAAVERRECPPKALRAAAYDALTAVKDKATARTAVPLFRDAARLAELGGMVPEDLCWRLAVLLRYAGLLEEAIAASEVLFERRTLSSDARLFPASTRAAAMIDLATARATPALLAGAERALRIAWALESDEESRRELRARWKRLDLLRPGMAVRGDGEPSRRG